MENTFLAFVVVTFTFGVAYSHIVPEAGQSTSNGEASPDNVAQLNSAFDRVWSWISTKMSRMENNLDELAERYKPGGMSTVNPDELDFISEVKSRVTEATRVQSAKSDNVVARAFGWISSKISQIENSLDGFAERYKPGDVSSVNQNELGFTSEVPKSVTEATSIQPDESNDVVARALGWISSQISQIEDKLDGFAERYGTRGLSTVYPNDISNILEDSRHVTEATDIQSDESNDVRAFGWISTLMSHIENNLDALAERLKTVDVSNLQPKEEIVAPEVQGIKRIVIDEEDLYKQEQRELNSKPRIILLILRRVIFHKDSEDAEKKNSFHVY